MDVSSVLPIASEIISHPGSFIEKVILILFAAVAFKFSVRTHFNKVENQLTLINSSLEKMGVRLDDTARNHAQHEERITRLESRLIG